MEIVLIRHGQPAWIVEDEYRRNPGLTELGKVQSQKSASVFLENSIDELWVSPLNRAQETHTPFKERNVAKNIITYDWLQEMEDPEEVALYGKSNDEIMAFFEKRNSQSFEEWSKGSHGQYMENFKNKIIPNLDSELKSKGIISIDDTYDRMFDLSSSNLEKIMIISHAGTMSVLLSYFLNMPLYPWTWRKFLPRHTGHTTLKSSKISGGHFFRLKEFNNVSFTDDDGEQTY